MPEGQVDTGRVTHAPQMHRRVQWKEPVRVATTANGTFASAFDNGSTVDGVSLATDDRILIKDQTDATENGIYVVQASGEPFRVYDFDDGNEAPGAAVYVLEGTANANTLWFCTNTTTPVFDDDDVTFEQFTGTGGSPGSVATDTIWDAKGDLAVGTGADTAAALTVGANDTILMADSAQTTGLKWVASQTPSTQAFGDSASQGTADTYARGDHKHAMPADPGGAGATGSLGPAFFGDGRDGDVTWSSSTTLSPQRDYYFNNLTVQTGVTVDLDANRIFVKGTLDLQGTAVIHGDGRAGGNGGNGTIAAGGGAGSAGSAGTTGQIGPAAPGIAGKAGGFNGNGQNGTAGGSTNMGIQHSAGAAGGNSNSNTGGSAGTAPTTTQNATEKPEAYPTVVTLRQMDGGTFTRSTMWGTAPGSGSGAGGSAAGGGGSGGSGASGNAVVICARTITGTGNIRAKGGAGGTGGNGFNGTGGSGGGGGGNGGAGGYVCLIYGSKTGWSGSIDVSGGAHGNGGTGAGSGTSGGNGNDGPSGFSHQFQMG